MLLGKNPNDPIIQNPGSDYGRELCLRLAQVASGFSTADVISACLNLVVNAMREAHTNRRTAEASYVEITGKARQLLLNHYDSVTGKRKSTFAHHQTITPELHVDDDRSPLVKGAKLS